MKPLPIESALLKICSESDEYLEYYHTYFTTKYILQKHYYPYIKDKNPYFTDHSINHVNRILTRLYELLNPHHLLIDDGVDAPYSNDSINTDRMSKKLNAYEMYLLLCSVLWHDIGNLYGRIEHEKNIRKYFQVATNFLHERTSIEWIEKICMAHSGVNAIDNHIDRETKNENCFSFFPKFIAALLRFADELDEDKNRIGERIYNEIPEENKIFWFFCKCNDSIKIEDVEYANLRKIVVEGRMERGEIFQKFIKHDLKKDTMITVAGVEEYIKRVEKINKERMYCGNYLKYHYFKNPNSVELRLRIYDNCKYIEEIIYLFDDVKGLTDFFNENQKKLERYM